MKTVVELDDNLVGRCMSMSGAMNASDAVAHVVDLADRLRRLDALLKEGLPPEVYASSLDPSYDIINTRLKETP